MDAHGVSDDCDDSGREWRRSSRSYGGGTVSRPPHGTVADSEFDQEGETRHVRQVEAETKTSGTRTATASKLLATAGAPSSGTTVVPMPQQDK